jgi:ABC-type proline/glycine betaine transport system permease subunit
MKSLSFMNRELVLPGNLEVYLMFGVLSLLWHLGSSYMAMFPEFGTIDRNIFLLILLSFIVFFIVVALCWWLLKRFWAELGLPPLNGLIFNFKNLEKWEQLSLYLASFALLLLALVGCLIGIC